MSRRVPRAGSVPAALTRERCRGLERSPRVPPGRFAARVRCRANHSVRRRRGRRDRAGRGCRRACAARDQKWRASSTMSSGRARSARELDTEHVESKSKVGPKRCRLPTAAAEAHRFAAAMMRTSTRRDRVSPIRRISPSCSARSSFAWARALSSITSSRNSVPPSASSKRPARSAIAPVKAPRAWPNNSASTSSSVKRRAVDRAERASTARRYARGSRERRALCRRRSRPRSRPERARAPRDRWRDGCESSCRSIRAAPRSHPTWPRRRQTGGDAADRRPAQSRCRGGREVDQL